MRPFNAVLANELEKSFGIEAICIVEIDWVPAIKKLDGSYTTPKTYVYSDKNVDGLKVHGLIDIVSSVSSSVEVNTATDNQAVSLTLVDEDGELLEVIRSKNVHQCAVRIYVHETNVPISIYHSGLIFTGYLDSPISYDYASRRLAFQAVSLMESKEAGFSVDEGRVPDPLSELVGEAWPMCFGTVRNVPALDLSATVKGTLAETMGVPDPLLPTKINAAANLYCPVTKMLVGLPPEQITFPTLTKTAVPFQNVDCQISRCKALESTTRALSRQREFVKTRFRVIGGTKFPQSVHLTLEIDGAQFTGYFNGTEAEPSDIFYMSTSTHPDLVGYDSVQDYLAYLQETKQEELSNCGGTRTLNKRQLAVRGIDVEALEADTGSLFGQNSATQVSQLDRVTAERNERSRASFQAYNDIPSLDFHFLPAGSEVRQVVDSGAVYVANIMPSNVLYVKAYRIDPFSKRRIFTTVPTSLYTTRVTSYEAYNVTEIIFETRLSRIRDAGWEDDIFVTLESGVGPNTVDILKWLIDTYSDLPWNSTFNTVRPLVDPFPMNFALFDRRDLNTLLQQIAFQARCSLAIRNGTYSLFYLPLQPQNAYTGTLPVTIPTFTTADLDSDTLQLVYTDIDDVVTKMVIEWRSEYSQEDPEKVILRHNVSTYGLREETYDFFCFTDNSLVRHAATFWLIRFANVWSMVEFTTTVNKLQIETLDPVSVTLPLTPAATPGVVWAQDYDSGEQSVRFSVWLPIKAGTNEVYRFAYPADLDVEDHWPTIEEAELGISGPGFSVGYNVTPPSDSPLLTGSPEQTSVTFNKPNPCSAFNPDELNKKNNCKKDHGEREVTDKNKVKPEPEVEGPSGPSTPETDVVDVDDDGLLTEEEINKQLEDNRKNDLGYEYLNEGTNRIENEAGLPPRGSSGSTGTGNKGTGDSERDDQDSKPGEGEPEEIPPECDFIVNVFYGNVTVVDLGGGSHSAEDGVSGTILAHSPTRTAVNHFSKRETAQSFADSVFAQVQAAQGTVGSESVVNVNRIFPACDDSDAEDYSYEEAAE